MTDQPVHLAILTTHPVQYAAPLFARISRESGIKLTVLYQSDISLRDHQDDGFGVSIRWNMPLLDGYECQFLPCWGDLSRLTPWRPLPRGLMGVLRRAKVDYLLIHGYGRPYHLAAMLMARAVGVKVLFRDEATPISRARGPVKDLLKQVFFRLLGLFCDGFMTIGTLNERYYRNNGIAQDKLFAMPYTVDNARFQQTDPALGQKVRRDLGIQDHEMVILYASKFQPRKHPDHLLEAFLNLPDQVRAGAHVVLVGDGQLRPKLQAMAAGHGNIHLVGFKDQMELPAYYAMCDLFVLPSSFEPWGLVVNEVMNFAKPVIVSDHVGCGPDLVIPGRNGLIYPVGDVAALGRSLAQLCADPGLARQMGGQSLEIISQWSFEQDVQGLGRALRGSRPGAA